jgi:hypothetical protein
MRRFFVAGFLLPVAALANDDVLRANRALFEIIEAQEEAAAYAMESRNPHLLNHGMAFLGGVAATASASGRFEPRCVEAIIQLLAVKASLLMSVRFESTRSAELNAAFRQLSPEETADKTADLYNADLARCETASGLKLVKRHLPMRPSSIMR